MLLLIYILEDFCNCAAADDHVTVIQDNGLTGGQRPLGSIEYHTGGSVFFGIDGGRLRGLVVAGFGGYTQGLRQLREGEPVPVFRQQGSGKRASLGPTVTVFFSISLAQT